MTTLETILVAVMISGLLIMNLLLRYRIRQLEYAHSFLTDWVDSICEEIEVRNKLRMELPKDGDRS